MNNLSRGGSGRRTLVTCLSKAFSGSNPDGRSKNFERVAELEKDKEILDWLNSNYLSTEFWIKLGGEPDVRTAIRQAMSAKSQ